MQVLQGQHRMQIVVRDTWRLMLPPDAIMNAANLPQKSGPIIFHTVQVCVCEGKDSWLLASSRAANQYRLRHAKLHRTGRSHNRFDKVRVSGRGEASLYVSGRTVHPKGRKEWQNNAELLYRLQRHVSKFVRQTKA